MTSATRSDDMSALLGVDARFPNTNQTKHCWQNYVDYHKCIIAKGEDFAPCRQVSTFAPSHSRWSSRSYREGGSALEIADGC